MSEVNKQEDVSTQQDLTEQWKRYFESLSDNRIREVTELAKKDSFEIDIYDEKENKWHKRTVNYNEIPSKKWIELESLRSKYNDIEKMAATKLLDKDKSSYHYTEELTKMNTLIYTKSAKYYLGLDEEDFLNSKWTQIRSIIDACNHRTVYTLPN